MADIEATRRRTIPHALLGTVRALVLSTGSQLTLLAAWASEYDLATNTFRTMDVVSNSFCAGGTVLGNGTWLNVG
jgi:hypothetical protein